MNVKLDHFPKFRDENSKNIWKHHLVRDYCKNPPGWKGHFVRESSPMWSLHLKPPPRAWLFFLCQASHRLPLPLPTSLETSSVPTAKGKNSFRCSRWSYLGANDDKTKIRWFSKLPPNDHGKHCHQLSPWIRSCGVDDDGGGGGWFGAHRWRSSKKQSSEKNVGKKTTWNTNRLSRCSMIFHDFFKLFRVVSCSVSTPGKTRDNTPLNDTLHHQQHTRTHTHTLFLGTFSGTIMEQNVEVDWGWWAIPLLIVDPQRSIWTPFPSKIRWLHLKKCVFLFEDHHKTPTADHTG